MLLPSVRRLKTPAERVAFFEAIEGRFAWQARMTTLIVGVSGFYLVERWDLWIRFADPSWWWMHAMVVVWVLLTVSLLTVLGAVAGSHGFLF